MRICQLAGIAALVTLTAGHAGADPQQAPAGREAFAGEWVAEAGTHLAAI